MKTISNLALKILTEYLLSHEQDIANKINDFGELHLLFVEVIGTKPDDS